MPVQYFGSAGSQQRQSRFNYLLRVEMAFDMLDFVRTTHPVYYSNKPEEQVQRGFDLLYNIVVRQMQTSKSHPEIRLGSRHTWFTRRFDFDTEGGEGPGPHDTAHNTPYDPNVETFFDTGTFDEKPKVDEELRLSRWTFLTELRGVLYKAHDEDVVPGEAIKIMWYFFMEQAGSNKFLKLWFTSEQIAAEWQKLTNKDAFLSNLDIGPDSIKRWVQQCENQIISEDFEQRQAEVIVPFADAETEVPGNLTQMRRMDWEISRFSRCLKEYASKFAKDVILRGFEEECADKNKWSKVVTERGQLYDEECPVCYSTYRLVANLEPVSGMPVEQESVPTKMVCGHIMCLPCFNTWINGDAGNSHKCPACRAKLTPENPHLKYINDFLGALSPWPNPNTRPATFARQAIEATDLFLSRLPTAIGSIELNEDTASFMSLTTWLANLNRLSRQVPEGVADYRNNKITQDIRHMAIKASLSGLLLARNVLEAYLNGDQDKYRNARMHHLFMRTSQVNHMYLGIARANTRLFESGHLAQVPETLDFVDMQDGDDEDEDDEGEYEEDEYDEEEYEEDEYDENEYDETEDENEE